MSEKKRVPFTVMLDRKLDHLNLHYKKTEHNGKTLFEICMCLDNNPMVTVHLTANNLGECRFMAIPVRSIPPFREHQMCRVLNDWNRAHRFVMLTLDENRDVCATYDLNVMPVSESTVQQAVSMLFQFARTVTKCTPEIETALCRIEESPEIEKLIWGLRLFPDDLQAAAPKLFSRAKIAPLRFE